MNGRFTLTTALVAAALLVPAQAWAAPGAASTADGYSTEEAGEMAVEPSDADQTSMVVWAPVCPGPGRFEMKKTVRPSCVM